MDFNEFLLLEEILGDLPEIQGFKPQFMYGTKVDMMSWIRQKRKEKVAYYPLVWVQTPLSLSGKPFASSDIRIIIANLASSDMSNIERTNVNFVKTLDPLSTYVLNALKSTTGISINETDSFEITRHFNYDTDDTHESTDIWDAIVITTTIEFNLNCL